MAITAVTPQVERDLCWCSGNSADVCRGGLTERLGVELSVVSALFLLVLIPPPRFLPG
jgi:hypothetical protein